MNKKVVSGKELNDKMIKSINMLCDAVKSTLGPSGNNVMINESSLVPYITNDGVTIAQNIESEDKIENTILSIAKESSIKTNELVGDGTTTTLVLLQSMFNDGMKLISNGYNPIKLKNEICDSASIVVKKLKFLKREFKSEQVKFIASTSANDEDIGSLISKVYEKTNLIKVNESISDKTSYEIVDGYTIDSSVVSNYFFNNKKEINLYNSYILLSIDSIESIYDLNGIMCEIEKNRSLVIVAEDFSEEVINECVMQNYQHTLNVVLIKSPLYGKRKYDVLNDISIITGSKVFNSNYGVSVKEAKICDLGIAGNVRIDNEGTTIINGGGNIKEINKLKNDLKNDLEKCTNEYEKEFIGDRFAKLNNGIGVIYVGASTSTERKEKKMRYEDALCAVNACGDGILIGEGLSLLKVKQMLKDNEVSSIVMNSLSKPFLQIMENMGMDKNKMLENIKNKGYKEIYNVATNKYESVDNTTIYDPYLVVKSEIINSASIAGMLLTTKYLVLNETNDNLNEFMKSETII